MSASDAAYEGDLIVPGDDAALADEFRSRGIQPGHRVHVVLAAGDGDLEETRENYSRRSSVVSTDLRTWLNGPVRF